MASPSLFSLPTTLSIQNHTFKLEHATTPQQRQKGLMYRESISSENAMLFSYSTPQSISVWMKNTFISLDILWLDNSFCVLAIKKGIPLSTAIHTPDVTASYLLEIQGGLTQHLNIKEGDYFIPN